MIKEYFCGFQECRTKFLGQEKIYERHAARGYNVYCSTVCKEAGRKIKRTISNRRFEVKRTPRNRKERLEKIRGNHELFEGYRAYQRNWYSKNKYGIFGEAHRVLLNLTKPMWRKK